MKRELTAKEHGDMIERDPKYQAMMAEKERLWAEMEAMLDRDEKPLVEALAAAGSRVKSVWDLVNTAESYPHLIQTLADHVTRPYHFRTREGIARALTVREARGTHVPRVLIDELKKQANPKDAHQRSYRWALINALVLIGDTSLQNDVRQLMQDARYATVCADLQRLAKALGRRGRKGKGEK